MKNTMLKNDDINSDNTKITLFDYKETIEFSSIKKLLNEEFLEYVTPYLAELLGVKKNYNLSCFIRPNENTIYSFDAGKIAKVILYVRLSVEDLEKSDGNVSKSILNQLLILLAYCQEHNLKVVGIFYEEDISGCDENRPEWNKSLTFCEFGYANTYICKTQARFARSIEMIQKFLYKKFVEWNIHFISIVDNIDTKKIGTKKSSQITAITDEWRVEEQSINTKKTLRTKNASGQWTGSFACYGYIEDPNDMYHLVVDEPAAKIVREIYKMFASGMGYTKICKELNLKKVPTPSKYKKLSGSKFFCCKAPNGAELWNTDTVRKILMNRTYDGMLIQHRTESIAYNVKGRKVIPEHLRQIVEKTHDRVVPEDISKMVRDRFKERKGKKQCKQIENQSNVLIKVVEEILDKYSNMNAEKKEEIELEIKILKEKLLKNNNDGAIESFNKLKTLSLNLNSTIAKSIYEKVDVITISSSRERMTKDGNIHMFSQKVYCCECGQVFTRTLCKSGSRKDPFMKPYLQCKNKKYKVGMACSNKSSIRYEVLEEIILNEINKVIEKYYNNFKVEKNYYEKKKTISLQNDINSLKVEKGKLENQINSCENRFEMLYEDKINGVISSEEFTFLKTKSQKNIENSKLRLEEIEIELNDLEKKMQDNSNFQKILKRYMHIDKLEKIIIDTFISKILIGKVDEETKKRDIKIIWNIEI